jgi:uncharacterized protein
LLPETTREKWYWAFISISAGFCEELLYRSFIFLYLAQLWEGISIWLIVIISSVVFGFGHTYQGIKGIIGTTVIGVMFAILYYFTKSIYPGIIIHFLLDVRILTFLKKPEVFTISKFEESI